MINIIADTSKKIKAAACASAIMFLAAGILRAGGQGAMIINPAVDSDPGRPGIQVPVGRTLSENLTFVYIAGPSGISLDGQISIRFPFNWTQPTSTPATSGYIVLSSTAADVGKMAVDFSTATNTLDITFGTTTLLSGQTLVIVYTQPYTQWTIQDGVEFYTRTKISAADTLAAIALQPRVDVVAGLPDRVTFEGWGLTVRKGAPSNAIRLRVIDNMWMTTKATAPITVPLAGKFQTYNPATYMYEYVTDGTAQFSLSKATDASGNFVSPVTQATVPTGATGVDFYYLTKSTEQQTIIEASSSLMGWTNTNNLWVTVVSGGISGAKIHKGDNANNKSATIGPDENAYFDFNLTDVSNLSWQVMISTSPSRTEPYLWTYWGWGTPMTNQVSWSGWLSYYDPVSYTWRNERAPNGAYYARIQVGNGGAIVDDTLSVTVQSKEISGRVVIDGTATGIPNVSVNCWGPSYSNAITDANGYYKLAGLRDGKYTLNFNVPGYSNATLPNISAGATNVNVALKTPAYIKISAKRGLSGIAEQYDLWGSIQANATDGTWNNYWGSLRFAVNISTSDNGQWSSEEMVKPRYEIENSTANPWNGGKWTILQVVPGTYTVRAELWGYGSVTKTVYVASGETKEIADIYFAPKKVIAGLVQLPALVVEQWAWVSLEATKKGDMWSSAWGQTQIPPNSSSGTYVIPGIDAGEYTIKTNAPGYRRGMAQVVVVSTDIAVTAPTITLAEGGGLSGTLTVEGNTNDPSISGNLYGGSDAGGDYYNLYLNAWSPDAYSYGWSQVKLYKNNTSTTSAFTIKGLEDGTYWINSWLYGFDLENSFGWQGVKATVKDGVGNINLKFKRYSGIIKVKLIVPNNEYNEVTLDVNGPNVWLTNQNPTMLPGATFYADTGVLISPPVGTGFYQIKARYSVSGYEKTKTLMALNGETKEVTLDLTAQTYSVSGKVKLSVSNPPAGINDIAQLVSTAPVYNTTYDMGPMTSTFRVSAIDYSKMETMAGQSGTTKNCLIAADGSYQIAGLVPGVYFLKIPSLELDGNWDNGKETASAEERAIIVNGNVSKDLEVSKGYSVSGQLKLPSGETATRTFYANVFKAGKFRMSDWSNYVTGFNVPVNGTSGNYTVKGLPPGDYVIGVQDWGYWDSIQNRQFPRQYVNSSVSIKIESSDLQGQDIQLSKGGTITLKLRDADSGTVITPANKDKMLPQSFDIRAVANPWVDGGWASLSSISGTAGQDKFELTFLPEADYDVMLGQSSYGMMMSMPTTSGTSGSNQTNYASKVVSAVKVKDGQTVDLGTIDIRQGITLSGTLKDKITGKGIANIPVLAMPSLTNEWSSELRAFTDINGKFSIQGLNPENPYYDVIACPRIDFSRMGGSYGYFFFGAGGISYGEKTRSMVKIAEGKEIDFALEAAKGSVKGKVVTSDGGMFQNFEDPNIPTAQIYMQSEETFPRTNPVGDIVVNTAIDGAFSVEALAPGTYRLTVLSGGYASAAKTVTVADKEVDVGTLTLKRGAKISGKITKADGKNPSTSEVNAVVAVTDDMSEIVLGTLKTTDKAVTGYELNGFQKDMSYNIMFIAEGDEMLPAINANDSPALAYSVPFSSYVKTDYDLKFQLAAPAVFSRSLRTGNEFTIYFDLTGALRKSIPDDDDLAQIISAVSGAGTISDKYIAPNRKSLSCKYTAPSGENKFTLKLRAHSKTVNAETGSEFLIDETFEFYAGIAAKKRVKVSNIRGGKISLEGDSSSVMFLSNSFDGATSTTSIMVSFMKGDDPDELSVVRDAARGAPRFTIPRAAQAYPGSMHKAMSVLRSASVSPLSSFYDVFLPKGVSRALKKDAKLTLEYSTSTAGASDDPNDYNVYYFDELNNVWLLENRDKVVDKDGKTITVGVNHTSIFAVVKSNAPIISGDSDVAELFVYNYPNPFGLSDKNVTLAKSVPANRTETVTGTMIHFGLPAGVTGNVEIRIYNVAGELVRYLKGASLGLDALAANRHYYIEWDGKNDYGKEVASGVYIGRFTAADKNEKFFKMALIK